MVCESEEKTLHLEVGLTDMPSRRTRKKRWQKTMQKKESSIQTRTFLAELGLAASSGVGSELRMPSYPPPLVHVSSSCPFPLSEPFVLCFIGECLPWLQTEISQTSPTSI